MTGISKIIATVISAATLCAITPAAAQDAPRRDYSEASAATKSVGDAYFAAYIGRDWDALETLLADDATFHDPTASLVFGGAIADGKTAMMTLFREGYASITHMQLSPTRSFQAGDVAVYEGMLDWGIDLGDGRVVDSVMPFVTILQLENGKVVSHRDYADYTPFIAALKTSRASE